MFPFIFWTIRILLHPHMMLLWKFRLRHIHLCVLFQLVDIAHNLIVLNRKQYKRRTGIWLTCRICSCNGSLLVIVLRIYTKRRRVRSFGCRYLTCPMQVDWVPYSPGRWSTLLIERTYLKSKNLCWISQNYNKNYAFLMWLGTWAVEVAQYFQRLNASLSSTYIMPIGNKTHSIMKIYIIEVTIKFHNPLLPSLATNYYIDI